MKRARLPIPAACRIAQGGRCAVAVVLRGLRRLERAGAFLRAERRRGRAVGHQRTGVVQRVAAGHGGQRGHGAGARRPAADRDARRDNRVVVSEQHLWAEPIRSGIARTLATRLARMFDAAGQPAQVTAYPQSSIATPAIRVTVDVVRFDAVPNGEAVVEAVWSIRRPGTARCVPAARSRRRRSPASATTRSSAPGTWRWRRSTATSPRRSCRSASSARPHAETRAGRRSSPIPSASLSSILGRRSSHADRRKAGDSGPPHTEVNSHRRPTTSALVYWLSAVALPMAWAWNDEATERRHRHRSALATLTDDRRPTTHERRTTNDERRTTTVDRRRRRPTTTVNDDNRPTAHGRRPPTHDQVAARRERRDPVTSAPSRPASPSPRSACPSC